MIRARAGASGVEWIDIDLREGGLLPDPTVLGGVVVTGSSASVTERAPWMLRAEDYLRALIRVGVPTFGICFGHQLLGQALGGHVAANPKGREIGTVAFDVLQPDPLLSLAAAPWQANATHVDTIARLPMGSRVLARTELENHAVVRFSEAAWGVQFHPEMDASVVRDYVEARREILLREGLDPETLLGRAADGAAGTSTLVRFVGLAFGRVSAARSH